MKKICKYVFLLTSLSLILGFRPIYILAAESSQTDVSIQLTKDMSASELPIQEPSKEIETAYPNEHSSKRLPKTGTEKSMISYIGMALLALLLVFKTVGRKIKVRKS